MLTEAVKVTNLIRTEINRNKISEQKKKLEILLSMTTKDLISSVFQYAESQEQIFKKQLEEIEKY